MSGVLMEYKGVRKLIAPEKVARMLQAGAVTISDPEANRVAKTQALAETARSGEEELAKLEAADRMTTGEKVGTFIAGAADTMSMGLADEARGLMNVADPRNIPDLLMGRTTTDQLYQGARDEQREFNKIAQEAAPVAYGTGTIAGILPAALGGAAGAKDAAGGVLRQAAGAVGSGAATGAVAGFGAGEGAEDSLTKAAADAAAGAILGGLTFGGASALTKGGREAVKGAAREQVQATSQSVRNMMKRLDSDNPAVRAAAREIIDDIPVVRKIVKVHDALKKAGAKPSDRYLRNVDEEEFKKILDDVVTLEAAQASKTRPGVTAAEQRGVTDLETEALMFEGGTSGKQNRAATPATPVGRVDNATAFRQQIADIKANRPVTPIPAAETAKTNAGRRSISGARKRPLSDDEATALVRAVAVRDGVLDASELAKRAGVSPEQAKAALGRLSQTTSFRQAMEKHIPSEAEWMEGRMAEALRSAEQRNPNGARAQMRARESKRSASKGSLQRAREQVAGEKAAQAKAPKTSTGTAKAPAPGGITDAQIEETARYLMALPATEQAKALAMMRQQFGPENTMRLLRKMGILQ